jgi:hypothetical protein
MVTNQTEVELKLRLSEAKHLASLEKCLADLSKPTGKESGTCNVLSCLITKTP